MGRVELDVSVLALRPHMRVNISAEGAPEHSLGRSPRISQKKAIRSEGPLEKATSARTFFAKGPARTLSHLPREASYFMLNPRAAP
jgi:hypothetical protein